MDHPHLLFDSMTMPPPPRRMQNVQPGQFMDDPSIITSRRHEIDHNLERKSSPVSVYTETPLKPKPAMNALFAGNLPTSVLRQMTKQSSPESVSIVSGSPINKSSL